MKLKPLLMIVGALVGCGAAAFGWKWISAGPTAAQVAAATPPLPDLTNTSVELRTRLIRADARARSRLSAVAGLGELSELYHANGFLAQAMQCYAGLEKVDPQQPRWPHLHASILAGYGRADEAIALWQRVVQLAPDYVPAWIRLGDAELKSNHPVEATAAYQAALARDPRNGYARLGLARLDFEARRWDDARAKLEQLVADTNYALGYDLIVTLYERLGETERARSIRGAAKAYGTYRDGPDPWLDSLLDACYDSYRLSLTAGTLARFGDQAAAQKLLERAVALAPQDVSARFQLGLLAVTHHNADLALDQLTSCTVIDPHFADPWAHLSALQRQLGDTMTAERTLAAGLANCPESPGLHLMRARSLRQAGRNRDAAAEYRVSLHFRPNEPDAYVELGSLYISEGRLDEAIQQMKLALEFDPANPDALSVLSLATIETGNDREARYWLNRAAEQPRIARAQLERFAEQYARQFGRAWDQSAALPNPEVHVQTHP